MIPTFLMAETRAYIKYMKYSPVIPVELFQGPLIIPWKKVSGSRYLHQ